MKKKVGLFVSNDRLSEYVYKKLAGSVDVYSFSLSPVNFAESTVFTFGDITGLLAHLKKAEVNELVFIGSIPASFLFKNGMHVSGKEFLDKSRPWQGEKILTDLISCMEEESIKVLPLTEILAEELATEKVYTREYPDAFEQADIEIGAGLLKDLMKYSVGQSVSVKNGMIVALEGIEGTDEMIRRTGAYCRNFVVVKIAGRNKDERFDMPVVGPETVETMKKSGGKVIAVEAGKTIILDEKDTVSMCNDNGIKFLGIGI